MNCILQDSVGDESTMYIGTAPIPKVKANEVLIKVAYTALNQMDLLQCKGLCPIPEDASKIIGVEVAGIIEEIGSHCSSKFKVGDRCLALLQGGGYAEYASAHECTVMLAPPALSMEILAAIPEQWITAFQLLYRVGKLESGESVLIHAASSGVGQAAIQLARSRGVKVIATCRSDDKVQCCLSMGADHVFNIKEEADTFSTRVKAVTHNSGVNAVLDPVGATYASQNMESLARDGRWVLYGTLSGKAIQDPNFLGKMLGKRMSLIPTTLRSRDYDYKAELTTACETEVLPLIANGTYQVLIDSTYDFTTEGVRNAHKRMASFANIGKIVIAVNRSIV